MVIRACIPISKLIRWNLRVWSSHTITNTGHYIEYIYVYVIFNIAYFIRKNMGNSGDNLIKLKRSKWYWYQLKHIGVIVFPPQIVTLAGVRVSSLANHWLDCPAIKNSNRLIY